MTETEEDASAERRNVARLVRAVAAFILIPTLSISAVMLWDPGTRSEHIVHAMAFAVLAVVSIVAMVKAKAIAARFVQG